MPKKEVNFQQAAEQQQQAVQQGINALWELVREWDEAMQSEPDRQAEIDKDPRFEINQAALSIAQVQVSEENTRIWNLAELAAIIGKRYGHDYIGTFAHDVNIGKSGLVARRQVVIYFGRDMLDSYRKNSLLLYTHFRLAMKVGQHYEETSAGTQAIKFLDDCLEFDWHTGQAEIEADKRIGKTIQPEKLCESHVQVVSAANGRIVLNLENPDALEYFRLALINRSRLKLKVFAVELADGQADQPSGKAEQQTPGANGWNEDDAGQQDEPQPHEDESHLMTEQV